MKKILLFAPLFAAAALFAACDDTNDEPEVEPYVPAAKAIDIFNDTYNLDAVVDVDTATFRYASPDGSMFIYGNRPSPEDPKGEDVPDFYGQYYVPADTGYIYKVLNFLEDEVFPVFGTEFIQKYMPRKIYFASEMQFNYWVADKEVAYYNIAYDVHGTFEGGTCCPEFIMFSHCCPDFDTMDKNYLKRLYVSLICEYIYSYTLNQEDHPLNSPKFEAFKQIGYDYTVGADLSDFGMGFFSMNENCMGYYESDADDFVQGWTNLGDSSYVDEDEWKHLSFGGEETWHTWDAWIGCELRRARIGVQQVYVHQKNKNDESFTLYQYYRTSHAQALGDYVAFIVTTTAAEKEAFWAEVAAAAANPNNGFFKTTEFVGGKTREDLLPDMQKRMNLVKEIFADLGITLADKAE